MGRLSSRRTAALFVVLATACTQHGTTGELELVEESIEEIGASVPIAKTAPTRRCSTTTAEAAPLDDTAHDRPTMRVSTDDGVRELPLVETTFETDVTGTIAQTTVTQVFANPFETPIEAVYVFPLPEDGAVDDYWIFVADRTIHGEMKRRAEARAMYEDAKREGKSAGLLEQERPNIFTQSIANIAPGASIAVEMHVVQPLHQDDGRYSFVLPTVVGPRFVPGKPIGHRGTGVHDDTDRVRDASRITPPAIPKSAAGCDSLVVDVEIDAGMAIDGVQSKFHDVVVERAGGVAHVTLGDGATVPNRDFELSWEVPADRVRGSMQVQRTTEGGFFTLTIEPPDSLATADAVARDVVFVVDTSGSMDGEPLDTAKQAVRTALDGLRRDDRFQIVQYAGAAEAMGTGLFENTRANRERARRYIDDMQGGGGTMMIEGVRAALGGSRTLGRIPIVLFLTDGYIGNEHEIFTEIDAKIGDARLFSLGVGSSVNRYLLDGMARFGRGAATYVGPGEKPDEVVDRFEDRIASPAMSDVEIDWGELRVRDVVPAEIPDVFVGQSVVVFGRFEGEPKGEIVLKGRRGKERVRMPIAVDLAKAKDGDGLASMWARQRIGDLTMDPAALVEDADARKKRTEKVVALALAHRVLTEHTAFVAIDSVKSVDGDATTVPVAVEVPAGVEMNAMGSMVGTEIGESYGVGGLGLVGTGRGGGGTGEGTIGLGSTGLIGKGGGGSGVGYGRGSAGAAKVNGRVPRVRMAKATVAGSIDKDLIRRVVRSHVGEVRKCYEDGLSRDPNLKGRVSIQFTIGKSGKVTVSVVAESSLSDDAVGECIAKTALGWKFPENPSGTIVITYPFVLEPG